MSKRPSVNNSKNVFRAFHYQVDEQLHDEAYRVSKVLPIIAFGICVLFTMVAFATLRIGW